MIPHGTLHASVRDEAVRHLSAGVSVELRGLTGSGKSLLARIIAAELEDAGWQVANVNGVATLKDRALEPLAIAGLMSRGANPQNAATGVASAVQGLLSTVRTGPTLLVIDDAQDLDEISVGAIAAAHATTPFSVLSTTTPASGSDVSQPSLSSLIQPGVVIAIPTLDYVDTQTLLVDTLGGPIESNTAHRIFAASGGLPGLTLTITEGARIAGTLRQVDGAWQAGADLWTPGAARAITPLLVGLSQEATEGLHKLSLAGPISVPTARILCTWEVLTELDNAGVLRFMPRDGEVLVSVFPLAITGYYRSLAIGAAHLRAAEAIAQAVGGDVQPATAPAAWHLQWHPPEAEQNEDLLVNNYETVSYQLIQEHWRREVLVKRTEWMQSPNPRTAAALLHTLLIYGADSAEVEPVRADTPRTGPTRDLVAFDDWYAIFVGVDERDVARAKSILAASRKEISEWKDLSNAVEAFIVNLIDHCPDPESLPELSELRNAQPDTLEIVATAKTELLLARGRSADALAVIDEIGTVQGQLAQTRISARAWALLLEERLDDALSEALTQLAAAQVNHDVEGIVGAAYVASQVLQNRGRYTEMRSLLGSVLSMGVAPALVRPQLVALMSIASSAAVDEGRTNTARAMALQALSLKTGPGPFPLGSPTQALAHIDGAELPPQAARALSGDRLWAEAEELVGNQYLVSGFVCGMLAIAEEATPERGKFLDNVAKQIPAPLITRLNGFVQALCSGDSEAILEVAAEHAEAGLVWTAARAYTAGLSALRAAGDAARATLVHEEARQRLAKWGPEAGASLRSAAEVAELTAREDEIARLAASGLSNQEIARRLLISVRTVENHLHRVFRKLGVDNRSDMSRMLSG